MKKSSSVPLRILSALAEIIRGPVPPPDIRETRYCVDNEGRIVAEVNCENSTLGVHYHYVYGGTSEGRIGDLVEGGSNAPTVYAPGFGARRGAKG